jgi:ABC-type nitrate/sulfonate/bicarbonate transport system substrate-binding protein
MKLRLSIFNTSSNLPLFAAEQAGCFAHHGIEVEWAQTPNSDAQREGLAQGQFDLAIAAMDNALALIDVAGEDVVVVCGGDGGMNDLMAKPEITRIEDLRGQTLGVDAPNTAFALVGRKILADRGLLMGRDYQVALAGGTGPRAAALAGDPTMAAAMINPPFTFKLQEQGLRSLGNQFDLIGPYQGSATFARRAWVAEHQDVLARYLAAYIEGQRRVLSAAHRPEMLALLQAHFKLSDSAAANTLQALLAPGSGLVVDAAISDAGFARTLAIRAELLSLLRLQADSAASQCLDLGAYQRALQLARAV